VNLAELTGDIFRPHLNERFQMHSQDAALDVTLIAVDLLRPLPSAKRQPFSLVFRGPAEPVWPQRIYRLTRDGLGDFDVFLVPIGPDEHGLRYEAIFT
jgi:hypothetical protein